MINILYSEIIKLKRSFVLIIMLIGGVIMPALMLFGWGIIQDRIVEWPDYVANSELMMFFTLGTLLFALVCSYIFSREFTDKTANIVFTYPNHRIKIFICKLLVVFLVIFIVYAINFVAMFGGGLILKHEPLTKVFLLLHFKLYVKSILLQFALTPVLIVIANLSKNVILPIIYGIIAVVINMCVLGIGKVKYSPFFMPAMPFYNVKNSGILENQTIIMGTIVFIIGFATCIVYYLRTDIN